MGRELPTQRTPRTAHCALRTRINQVRHGLRLSEIDFVIQECAARKLAGWHAVGGMAGVGLFYMAIGLLNLGSTNSIFTDEGDLTETSAHRLSGVTNVDDLAVERKHESANGTRSDYLAKASH